MKTYAAPTLTMSHSSTTLWKLICYNIISICHNWKQFEKSATYWTLRIAKAREQKNDVLILGDGYAGSHFRCDEEALPGLID